ncbi:MAG TPA: hypothetical protein VIU64_03255 [Polyangia bacterium]
MPSRWFLYAVFALGLGLVAWACGPQKAYCVDKHDVCGPDLGDGGAYEDDAGDQTQALTVSH